MAAPRVPSWLIGAALACIILAVLALGGGEGLAHMWR